MKKLCNLIAAFTLFALLSGCDEGREGTETADTGDAGQSDKNCPPATTFGSGAPPGASISFGILHGRPSGGTGTQVNMLLTEFNNTVQRLGDAYCASQGCYAEIVPATDAHIKTGKSDDHQGWTELTIIPTGGNPRTVTTNLNVYFSYIDPPSPNCYCREYVIEDPGITVEDLITPPNDTGATPGNNDNNNNTTPPENQPEEDCGDPTPMLTLEAGTKLDTRAWRVNSYFDPIESYPGLTTYVQTQGPAAAQAFLDAKLASVQCPEGCEAYWDPEPSIKKESGYPNLPRSTYIVRFVLENQVTIRCRPVQ